MIGELLAALGLPGQLVTAALILYGIVRMRSIVGVLSSVATMTWIGIVAVGIFLALVFALPGLDIVVNVQTLVESVLRVGVDIIMRVLEAARGLAAGGGGA